MISMSIAINKSMASISIQNIMRIKLKSLTKHDNKYIFNPVSSKYILSYGPKGIFIINIENKEIERISISDVSYAGWIDNCIVVKNVDGWNCLSVEGTPIECQFPIKNVRFKSTVLLNKSNELKTNIIYKGEFHEESFVFSESKMAIEIKKDSKNKAYIYDASDNSLIYKSNHSIVQISPDNKKILISAGYIMINLLTKEKITLPHPDRVHDTWYEFYWLSDSTNLLVIENNHPIEKSEKRAPSNYYIYNPYSKSKQNLIPPKELEKCIISEIFAISQDGYVIAECGKFKNSKFVEDIVIFRINWE